MIDDAFRELFNRKSLYSKLGNRDFNVTIFLKTIMSAPSHGSSVNHQILSSNHSIYAIAMPLSVINMNLEIR